MIECTENKEGLDKKSIFEQSFGYSEEDQHQPVMLKEILIHTTWHKPESLIQVAIRMTTENPFMLIFKPFKSSANQEGTAKNYLWACDDKLSIIAMYKGRKNHERAQDAKQILLMLYEQDLAILLQINKKDIKSYKVEGIGSDFIPKAHSCQKRKESVRQNQMNKCNIKLEATPINEYYLDTFLIIIFN